MSIYSGKTKELGCVIMLPSHSRAVIVQYQPEFRISCLLPPKKQTCYFVHRSKRNLKSREISVPPLLLSAVYFGVTHRITKRNSSGEITDIFRNHHFVWCLCNKCLIQRFSYVQYFLFALKKDKDILGTPYRLGNVFPEGKICFSLDRESPPPNSLRQANNIFWSNYFNTDFVDTHLLRGLHGHCQQKDHSFEYDDHFQKHQCEGHEHTKHTCEKDKLETCFCCYSERNGGYYCGCNESCYCCCGVCKCRINFPSTDYCECGCCRNICNCRCSCDLSTEFADLSSSYTPRYYNNYTSLICGSRFISQSKNTQAVFISDNKDLLTQIPEKMIKSVEYEKTTYKFVVAFADMEDNKWKIGFGDSYFYLDQDKVMPTLKGKT